MLILFTASCLIQILCRVVSLPACLLFCCPSLFPKAWNGHQKYKKGKKEQREGVFEKGRSYRHCPPSVAPFRTIELRFLTTIANFFPELHTFSLFALYHPTAHNHTVVWYLPLHTALYAHVVVQTPSVFSFSFPFPFSRTSSCSHANTLLPVTCYLQLSVYPILLTLPH